MITKDLIIKGVYQHVRNGENINIWEDPWILKLLCFKLLVLAISFNSLVISVHEHINLATNNQDLSPINQCLSPIEFKVIKKIYILNYPFPDLLIWNLTPDGQYLVKLGYDLMCLSQESSC